MYEDIFIHVKISKNVATHLLIYSYNLMGSDVLIIIRIYIFYVYIIILFKKIILQYNHIITHYKL